MPHVIIVTMKTNAFEVAAKYVYPSLRRRLVEILYREHRLKQMDIARLLHITQSAVSRYLKMDRGALIDVESFEDIDEELRKLAMEVITNPPGEYELHSRLVLISLEMLGKGYVCSFHSRIDPEIDPGRCQVCLDLFGE